ncbi:MAG: hypothetical protein C0618_09450 [Desulfuromonas sp.]|nr:MAG: hypothetical protein C0618_09450 [Desulfuromonas sp.]
MLDDFLDYLQHFRTDRIIEQLAAWNIDELSTDPYVLGLFAIAIGGTYLLGWKTLSAFIVGIGGFALSVAYTVKQNAGAVTLSGENMGILVGSGVLVIGLFIYLLFIRSD